MTYPPQYPYPGSEEERPKRKRWILRNRSRSAQQTAAKPALGAPAKVVVAILAAAIAVLSVMIVTTAVDVWSKAIGNGEAYGTQLSADHSGIKFAQTDWDGRRILHVRYDPQAKSRRDAFHARVMQAAAEITGGPSSEGAAQIEAYLARHAAPDADAAAASCPAQARSVSPRTILTHGPAAS